MEIKFNITGTERKALVTAVSELTGGAMVYKGAPTFAFAVNNYIIDRYGTLTGEDNYGLVADLHGLHGFKAVSEEYDTPLPEPVPEDVQIPYEAALGGRVSPYHDYEEPPAYGTPKTDERNSLVIEMPRDGFTDTAIVNLEKLVESKAALIQKAINTDSLPIEKTDDKLRFPWFSFDASADEANAYTHFISALCAMAKEQKRVTAKEKPVDNEKYAFRCFLLRLGFIGNEFKDARRILLANLDGNGAFKSGERRQDDETISGAVTAPDTLAEALPDAELIHAVKKSFDTETAGGGGNE